MIIETFLLIFHAFTINFPFKFGFYGGSKPSPNAGITSTDDVRRENDSQNDINKADSEPSDPAASETAEKEKKKRKKFTYKTQQLGVWELKYTQSSRFSGLSGVHLTFLANVRLLRENWPLVIQFLKETYAVAPKEVICYLTHSLWHSLQGSLTMYFTSRLLELVSNAYFLLKQYLTNANYLDREQAGRKRN